MQRIIVLAFAVPLVLVVFLLETGQKAAAGLLVAVLLALGVFVILMVRRARAKQAGIAAARAARREAKEARHKDAPA